MSRYGAGATSFRVTSIVTADSPDLAVEAVEYFNSHNIDHTKGMAVG